MFAGSAELREVTKPLAEDSKELGQLYSLFVKVSKRELTGLHIFEYLNAHNFVFELMVSFPTATTTLFLFLFS